MDTSKIYTVLQICDSAFPTGGFSHSMGAEAAIQFNQIKNKNDLKIFILSCIENAGSSCIPYIRAAHDAFQNSEKLEYLDSLLNASLLNHVEHRASKQQGKAFLTAASEVFPSEEVIKLKQNVEQGKLCGHLAIVFPVICASLKISTLTTGQMFLFNALRTVFASMVRLGKIGAVQAQQWQYEIQKLLGDVLERCWSISPEDSYISFPLPEVLQNSHDTLFSKLFYS